jgi:hypothetical protein
VEQDLEKELRAIINSFTCPKDFKCYRSGFEALCKARDVGLETFIECFEDDPFDCPFSMRLHGVHYCKCPLRVYIAKKLKK